MSEKEKVVPQLYETYLAVINNAVGANLFRTMYALVNGTQQDLMRDGDLSCAFFVSSILKMFDQIGRVHGTVASTLKDMAEHGWQKTAELEKGAVVVWEEKVDERGEAHKHLGFYLGDALAVSNNAKTRTPQKHHYTYGENNGQPVRKITDIFWKNFN